MTARIGRTFRIILNFKFQIPIRIALPLFPDAHKKRGHFPCGLRAFGDFLYLKTIANAILFQYVAPKVRNFFISRQQFAG
jgi:hypothetical protein